MSGWIIGIGLATAAGVLSLLAVTSLGAEAVEAILVLRDHAMCIPVVEVPPATLHGAQGVGCLAPGP